MKKILSCVLAAVMLVGALTFGVVAEQPDQMLKFNDILKKGGGGDVGMVNYLGGGVNSDPGYTVVMDFIYGRSGVCYHPTDTTMKHTSKFVLYLGDSEKTHKYVGYSATEDAFFVGICGNSPTYGEGVDGIEYLALSEKGLVKPGVKYTVAYEFIYDTIVNIYLDRELVLSFDLYEDLDYPTYFMHNSLMMYPTHMTCFVDNLALYAANTYNAATGEGIANPVSFNNFDDDAEIKEVTETDANGKTTTYNIVSTANWQVVKDAYTLADPASDVYAQPQYTPEEGQANIIFRSGLDRKANGADDLFSSGKDFVIDLTIKNNAGLNSLALDLVSDPYITVKSVEAAEGLTATLGETDANGITKLTVTGDNYTGEALASITYSLSADAVQDLAYSYGALTDAAVIDGADAVKNAVITNGTSTVYNFTVGDVNDDGKFNLADVSDILKFVAKWDMPGKFKDACDVNLDGRVNTMDASYYLRWIARWPYDFTINGITWYPEG